MNRTRTFWALMPLVSVLVMSPVALAVKPAVWTQATEADFATGRLENTVVTSRGYVTLGRQIQVLMAPESAPTVVTALAAAGKTLYAASGTQGVIYKIVDNKASEFAKPGGTFVSALLWTGTELLAGVSGSDAGVYRIDDKGQSRKLWSDPQVKYVWALVGGSDGTLYAATGGAGRVVAIDKAGKAEVLYDPGDLAKNILCLARSPQGLLYVGTDTNGLVVEIDPGKKTARIILDAAEKEISAVVVADGGGVYAATADAAKASPDGSVPAGTEKVGTPVAPTTAPATAPGHATGAPAPATAPATQASVGKVPATAPAAVAAKAPATAATTAPAGSAANGPAATAKANPMSGAGGLAVPAADATPPVVMIRRTMGGGAPAPAPAGPPPAEGAQGNAVYFIAPDGLVHVLFRKPVTILSMILQNGQLILGTGNGGRMFSVQVAGEETTQLADVESKQVTALAVGEGGVFFGTSNKGSVGLLGKGQAAKGAFTCKPLDALQVAKWGTMQIDASIPHGAKLTVATRSGHLPKDEDKTWSPWSAEQEVGSDFLPIVSPAGRYLQYRLSFAPGPNGPPLINQVQMIYQVGNLPPELAGIMVVPTAKGMDPNMPEIGPKVYRHVLLRAADPNQDALSFTIEMRPAGTQTWIRLAKNLGEPKFVWDSRTVPDGTYELRVTASDSPNNPPGQALTAVRLSEPVVVDNTPPAIKDLAAKIEGGKVIVRGMALDATSRIVSIFYAVDGQSEWTAVLPTNGMCDNAKESFAFEIDKLEAGTHLVVVKVTDLYDNTGYATVSVTK